MRRNQTLVLTQTHLQDGIWWYLYHERFKRQCVNPSVCPGSWLSTDQSSLGRGRSTEEQSEQSVSQRKYLIFSTRKYESSKNCKKMSNTLLVLMRCSPVNKVPVNESSLLKQHSLMPRSSSVYSTGTLARSRTAAFWSQKNIAFFFSPPLIKDYPELS